MINYKRVIFFFGFFLKNGQDYENVNRANYILCAFEILFSLPIVFFFSSRIFHLSNAQFSVFSFCYIILILLVNHLVFIKDDRYLKWMQKYNHYKYISNRKKQVIFFFTWLGLMIYINSFLILIS